MNMFLKAREAGLVAALIMLSVNISFAGPRQAARTLPEYWYDDDEWHLEVQYIITTEELEAILSGGSSTH